MCGCSKSAPTVSRTVQVKKQSFNIEADLNCPNTREQLESLKDNLLIKKNPENATTVNGAIGLINTMLNHGKYCLYDITKMYLN